MSKVRIDLGYAPRLHQKRAHQVRLQHRFLVLVWHRRAGKTVFSILEAILAALACKKPRGRFAYIAPQLKQCKTVVWDYLQHFAHQVPGVQVNQAELRVDFPNGAQVRLFGADNPDSLRGIYLDGVVFDEVADMPPNVWSEIIRPAIADRQGWAIFIGTPKGVNLFSELYYKALKGDDPLWAAMLMRWEDSEEHAAMVGVTREEVRQAKSEQSEAQAAQEWDCDFNASVDDVLLKLSDVLSAQERDCKRDDYINAAKVLGVDIARYGGDRISIQKRQGIVAFSPKVFTKGMDLMTLAGQVAFVIDEWNPDAVFLDIGGMGAGVADRLRQLQYTCIVEVDFGQRALDESRFDNKRTEMWWEMAQWVKSVGILPSGQEMQQDLAAPRYTHKNKRGRMQLESKDDLRKRGLKSPDVGDALALTFAAAVAPRSLNLQTVQGRVLPKAMERTRVQHDYDPFGDDRQEA